MALKEQKRVTRTGGWVVTAGPDEGFSIRHPPCPAYEKVMNARLRYCEYQRARFEPDDDIPVMSGFSDPHAGRKCVEWFTKAGLKDLKMQVVPAAVAPVIYPGTKGFERKWGLNRCSLDGWHGEHLKGMIDAGFLDEELLEQAYREIEAWYDEPYACLCRAYVVIAGRA